MIYLIFAPLLISLAVYFIPAVLLHKFNFRTAQDYFVASTPTSPKLFQNASIAYQLQMATFGPFFLWGSTSDFWPAIVNSTFFGFGLLLVYFLRRPLFAFLDEALGNDSSITVHQFICRQHGNDPRVRVAASLLTIFALFGLALGESIGLLALLRPFLSSSVEATYGATFLILLLVFLYAILAGNSGVMRSDQTHLGVAYFGLFAATGLLLIYQLLGKSESSIHSLIATIFVGLVCPVILIHRRFVVLDTVRITGSLAETTLERSAAIAFQWFEKLTNWMIVLAATLVFVASVLVVVRDASSVALSAPALRIFQTQFSSIGFLALSLLPLFYAFVDITNWQRLAAIEKNRGASKSPAFSKAFMVYVFESPLIWIFMCMFGALAASTFGLPGEEKDIGSFVQSLVQKNSGGAVAVVTLLLLAAFAMSLSTINSVFAASLCAIRYDIFPSLEHTARDGDTDEAKARKLTTIIGVVLYLAIVVVLYGVEKFLSVQFGAAQFVALLFAFYCAQLSFVPLILGPILRVSPSGFLTLNGSWALAVLLVGIVVGLTSISIYLATGSEAWLWAAVPLCLTSGFALFVIGSFFSRPAFNESNR
jgi:hypothetical protein